MVQGYTPVNAEAQGQKPKLNRHFSAPPTSTPSSHSSVNIDPMVLQAPVYNYDPNDKGPANIKPPTYDSVFGPAGTAFIKTTAMISDFGKSNEDDEKGKKKKYVPDTCCEVFWKFVLVNVILCGVPLAQMVVGILYFNQCPLSNKVPLYMVLNGVGWFLIGVRLWAPNWVDKRGNCLGTFLVIVSIVAVLFAIIWFVLGSYWVFTVFKDVEYQPPVVKLEPMVKVEPNEEIKGPFTNNTFIVMTKQGTKDHTLRIKWNGKEREFLEISGTYIDLCDKRTAYNGTGTVTGGDWSVFFNFDVVKVWFDGEIVVNSTIEDYTIPCYFWRRKVDKITAGNAAVSVRFEDKTLNEMYFGQETYCHKTLFLFAFICLVIIYVIFGASAAAAFCMQ